LLGGGMSRVFVAREIALDRTIVIKFLPPRLRPKANRERFRREIQMAARLSHPHIAPLFSAAEDGELLYYTMRSSPVSRCATRWKPVADSASPRRSKYSRCADALAYAHKAASSIATSSRRISCAKEITPSSRLWRRESRELLPMGLDSARRRQPRPEWP